MTKPASNPKVQVKPLLGGLFGYRYIATQGSIRKTGWAFSHNEAVFAGWKALPFRVGVFA